MKWTVDLPSRSVNILDLTLNIRGGVVHSCTFQKELNLKLYIPPHSEQPKSCVKEMVTGILIRFWEQNSAREDFRYFAKDFSMI
mmetsp:Transcript_33182/g.65721  ORF Transcript_33182/g.65721 Transcript_33182/m.65721 type:complete len:84 (+) Transcript_33182:353-604(+)